MAKTTEQNFTKAEEILKSLLDERIKLTIAVTSLELRSGQLMNELAACDNARSNADGIEKLLKKQSKSEKNTIAIWKKQKAFLNSLVLKKNKITSSYCKNEDALVKANTKLNSLNAAIDTAQILLKKSVL